MEIQSNKKPTIKLIASTLISEPVIEKLKELDFDIVIFHPDNLTDVELEELSKDAYINFDKLSARYENKTKPVLVSYNKEEGLKTTELPRKKRKRIVR
jgi:hypothetical protein